VATWSSGPPLLIDNCKPGDELTFVNSPVIRCGPHEMEGPSHHAFLMCFISGHPFCRFVMPDGRKSELLEVLPGQEVIKGSP
jgi:hypothetical protein